MKDKLLKLLKFIISTVVHMAILYGVYLLWLPIAEWYLTQSPAKGIDLYNSVSYVSYLIKHFVLRVNGWKYIWFAGNPFALDYQSLYFYLMIPFAKYFGLVKGVEVFAIAANFLFIAFSYLLFSALSKNRVLSALLSLGVLYSVNIYRSLVYAGGIPFVAAQIMLPLVLWVVVKYLQTHNRKYLLLSALISGFGAMGHPQPFIMYIFPAVIILLTISSYHKDNKYFGWYKFRDIFAYFAVTILVGLPGLYHLFFRDFMIKFAALFGINLLGIDPPDPVPIPAYRVEWVRQQFYVAFSDMNQVLTHLLFVAIVAFILGTIIRKNRRLAIVNSIAHVLIVGWVIFYIYLLSLGIDFYHGGIEAWYKLFWALPVVLGALVSQLWGVFTTSISERINQAKYKLIANVSHEIVFGLVFLLLGYMFFTKYSQQILDKIDYISVYSSAFPGKLNVNFSDQDLVNIKDELKPSFIKDIPEDLRLYSNDQTFNLSWNVIFDTPLARGYIDPPGTLKDRWGLFWLDSVLGVGDDGNTSLEDDWGVPAEVVENNIYYLLDWYGVGYLEGNHIGGVGGLMPPQATSEKYVEKEEIKIIQGAIAERDYLDVDNVMKTVREWNEQASRAVNFYKIKTELVSPIHQATNAPALLLIGGEDSFDIITRLFGMMNYASDRAIVAKGSRYIDDISLNDMKNFDAIILYKYDYHNHNNAWTKVLKYVKEGGNLFVDTGTEVKEADTEKLPGRFPSKLPEIFPINKSKRGNLGKSWGEKVYDSAVFADVDLSELSPFDFDNAPWNISYPSGKQEDLRTGAEVMLKVHDYPVLVSQDIGEGRIVWSGINLPYHALYNYNLEEGKIFFNILKKMIDFTAEEVTFDLEWISPEKRSITAVGASGVLFKEKAFSGWKAQVENNNKKAKLPIYEVGPSSPGFIYVPIPKNMQTDSFKVTFSYIGTWDSWVANIISIVTMVVVFDYILLKGFLFRGLWSWSRAAVNKMAGTWWKKEDVNY